MSSHKEPLLVETGSRLVEDSFNKEACSYWGKTKAYYMEDVHEAEEHRCILTYVRLMGLRPGEMKKTTPTVEVRYPISECSECFGVSRGGWVSSVKRSLSALCCITADKGYVRMLIPLILRDYYHALVTKSRDGVKSNFQALFNSSISDPKSAIMTQLLASCGPDYVARLRSASLMVACDEGYGYPVKGEEMAIDFKHSDVDEYLDVFKDMTEGKNCEAEYDVEEGHLRKEAVHPMVPGGCMDDAYGVYANTKNNVKMAQEKRFPETSDQGRMSDSAEKKFTAIADLLVDAFRNYMASPEVDHVLNELVASGGPSSFTREEFNALLVDCFLCSDPSLYKHRDIFIKKELSLLAKLKPRLIYCFDRARTGLEWILAELVTAFWTKFAGPATIKNIPRAEIAERFKMNSAALDKATTRIIKKKFVNSHGVLIIDYVMASDGNSWDGSVGPVAHKPLLTMYTELFGRVVAAGIASQDNISHLLKCIAEESNLTLEDGVVSLPPCHRVVSAKTKWRFTTMDEFKVRDSAVFMLREMMRSGRVLTSVGNAIVNFLLQCYTDFDNPSAAMRGYISDESERPVLSGPLTIGDKTVQHARIAYVEGDDGSKQGRIITDEILSPVEIAELLEAFGLQTCKRAGEAGFVYEARLEVLGLSMWNDVDEAIVPFCPTGVLNHRFDYSSKMMGVGVVEVTTVASAEDAVSDTRCVATEFVGGHLLYRGAKMVGFFPDIGRSMPKLQMRPNSLGGPVDDLAFLIGLLAQCRCHPNFHATVMFVACGLATHLENQAEMLGRSLDELVVSKGVNRGVQMALTGAVAQTKTTARTLMKLLDRESRKAAATVPFDCDLLDLLYYDIPPRMVADLSY